MSDENKQINAVLNIVFYALTLITIALYFYTDDPHTDKTWLYCGIAASGVWIISFVRRRLM